MSQIEFHDPVKTMRGKYEKGSKTILRKKMYRAPTGKVLKEGVQEAYVVVNPRDFEKNPPKGDEYANMRTFGDISLLSSELIRSEKFTDEQLAAMTPEEREHVAQLREILDDFRKRFYAQFKKPDPEAPFEKKPDPNSTILRRKQYLKLDNFIQAILRERRKMQ